MSLKLKPTQFSMRQFRLAFLGLVFLAGCPRHGTPGPAGNPAPGGANQHASSTGSLKDARQGFTTKLLRKESAKFPVPDPPANIFRTVHFVSQVGKLAAYLTPDPRDGKK